MPDFPEEERGWIVEAASDGDAKLSRILGMMNADELRSGFSDVGTRNLLYTLVLNLRPKQVLEIGTHIGTASVVIASALRSNGYGHLLSLEPQAAFRDRALNYLSLAGLGTWAEVWQSFSYEEEIRTKLRERAPFELVYIDGAHEYEAALADIMFGYEMLRENGFIVLHDVGVASSEVDTSLRGGPRSAMKAFLRRQPEAAPIFFEYPLWPNPCGAALICKQSRHPA